MTTVEHLRPTPCPHPEWQLESATLGATGATGWLRCVLCGAVAPDAGPDADG